MPHLQQLERWVVDLEFKVGRRAKARGQSLTLDRLFRSGGRHRV
jgi:hypothetical protein